MQTDYSIIATTFSTDARLVKRLHEYFQMRESKWPEALIKATTDEFNYAMSLRNGDLIQFRSAEFLNPSTVKVIIPRKNIYNFELPRGLEIKLDQIVWVSDAPTGAEVLEL